MKPIRLLVGALLALAALPASASAQSDLPPGTGDNYLSPVFLADQTHPMPLTPSVIGFNIDTSANTTETGPIWGRTGTEFNLCGRTNYGKTEWSVLYTNRYGRLDITAVGYDAVIGVASFNSPSDPQPSGGPCVDRLSGKVESFPADSLPTVRKNHWYAIQVGGAQQADGTFAGGPLEVDVELLPPEAVAGDAILSYKFKGNQKGVTVSGMKVTGPVGSTITVKCLKKSCGKTATVKFPAPAGSQLKRRPLTELRKVSAPSLTKEKPDPIATAAKTKSVFAGRKIPSGARLQVTVTAPNEIGDVFYWDVKGHSVGTKTHACAEPGSSKPRTFGSCDGK
jgi:hypothetical protein